MQSTILVVDDEESMRYIMQMLLHDEGSYTVFVAESGQEALNLLLHEHCQPDLIIVDERMPHMTGQQFICSVQAMEAWRHVPTILFSACHIIPVMCQEHHADAFLLKPFEMDELFGLVKRLLSEHAQKREEMAQTEQVA